MPPPWKRTAPVGAWRSHFRHSRTLLAGIQANFGLDPRLKHSGVTSWDVVPAFSSSLGAKLMNNSFENRAEERSLTFVRDDRVCHSEPEARNLSCCIFHLLYACAMLMNTSWCSRFLSGNVGDGFAAVVCMCLNALMKIPISAKIPRSYGPAPLQRGLLGDFSGVVPDHCGSFSCAVLYRLVHELL